ncbi:HAD family hydrolase [Streptococcus sp. DD13]|uniref:HAD family hydrolase n=1 Tax=Streptococcus sp. DD13 TaxID=1777881 RepID=UPI000798B238|nr:HAD family hydrolase [Streptococcus sp. DD13]KXT79024.1 hypothetical protein STRDD13_00280 [Streptococcus sp. DD13]
MPKFAYKNYLFDFYGTLVDIHTDEEDPLVWEQLAALYRAYGINYSGEGLHIAYKDLIARAEKELKSHLQIDFPEPDLRVIFAQLYLSGEKQKTHLSKGVNLRSWGDYLANTFRILSRKRLAPYPCTHETLEKLKKKGARLFLLSNAQASFTQSEIDLTACRPFFEKIYLSSDYQMRKPQADLYRRVLAENHLEVSETVMVGNDLFTDMAGAGAIGLDGILLNTFPYSEDQLHHLNPMNHPVIRNISELG